jgi:site-specific recombinase XerD
MTDPFHDFELQANGVREENAVILEAFEKALKMSGLKEKSIRKHLSNIDFYINHYLLYDGLNRAKDGVVSICGFFDWFFPRKAMWSSPSAVKENIASLKKFYHFMMQVELIDDVDYQFLLAVVKEEKDGWLARYEHEYDW